MNFKTGDVIKIYFLQTLLKHRRVFYFTGLCIKNNKKTGTFTIQNFYGSEFLTLSFRLNSPNILFFQILKSYNFYSKLSKLYHFKKIHLFSHSDILIHDNLNRIYKDSTPYLYQSKTVGIKEKKRLRNKFRL
jgi:ribosomal protein L19